MRGMQGMQGMGMQGMWIGKLGAGTVSHSSGARLSCLGEGWGGFLLMGGGQEEAAIKLLPAQLLPPRQAQAPRAEQSFAFANQ